MQSVASLMSLDRQHDIASADDFDDEEPSAHNTSDDMTWSSKINQMTAEFQSFTSQDDMKLGPDGDEHKKMTSLGELRNAFDELQDDEDEEDLGELCVYLISCMYTCMCDNSCTA